MSAAVIDLETTTYTSFKRKANPFDPRNYIVMAGALCQGEQWGKHWYAHSKEEASKLNWFVELLESGVTILIGHNIKFDLHHLIQVPHNYVAFKKWVANGGKIWDTQLAEYLLNGMGPQDQYLSLDEVAPRYGGNLKIDEVKLLWESGVDTADIDPGLLQRYLVGDPDTGDQGDLGNTMLIFKGQLERARKVNQLRSILLNMGSMLYTIEAEHNGMAVDYELGLELAAERQTEFDALGLELAKFIPDDLPFDFNWGSRNHLSALIFGGDVKYKARVPVLDDEGKQVYAQKTIECYIMADDKLEAVEDHEEVPGGAVRFSSGKRKGEPKTKKVKSDDLTKPKSRIEDCYYRFAGFTQADAKWKTKTPGVYSTSSDVIEALGNRGIPFLDTLSSHAAVSKDLKTYFITTDEKTGEKKGMLTLVDNGFIHHSLNHVNTVTGRFSSSNPN